MNFLNRSSYFEKYGDRFIYRPTIFSAGFSLSEDEKDRLFQALKRLERSFFIGGFSLIILLAGTFMAGIVNSAAPIAWFMLSSIAAVVLLSITAIHRRHRLIVRTLGHRDPDVPRMPIRQALTKPRPVLAKRYTIPIMRSMIGLIVLAIVAFDTLAALPIIAALRSRQFADGLAENEAIAEMLALTLNNIQYVAAVALINVLLLLAAALLYRELRRLRTLADFS